MNRADKLFEEIQALPRADRLRLAERVIRETAREPVSSETSISPELEAAGVVIPPVVQDSTPPPRALVAPLREILEELRADRDGR